MKRTLQVCGLGLALTACPEKPHEAMKREEAQSEQRSRQLFDAHAKAEQAERDAAAAHAALGPSTEEGAHGQHEAMHGATLRRHAERLMQLERLSREHGEVEAEHVKHPEIAADELEKQHAAMVREHEQIDRELEQMVAEHAKMASEHERIAAQHGGK